MDNRAVPCLLPCATFLLAGALSFAPLFFILLLTPLNNGSWPPPAVLYCTFFSSAVVGALATWLGEPRLILRKLAVLGLLLLGVSFFPMPSQITTCRYCIWTISGAQGGGLYNKEWRFEEPVGYYFYGTLWDFRAGKNDEEINRAQRTDRFKHYKWHRLRLGFPFQSITIDKMDDVGDWHMHFEAAFWMQLAAWILLWLLYQLIAAVVRYFRGNLTSSTA